MKPIKIGKVEYQQIETAEDLPIKRYNMLKEYILWKETGVNVPSLVDTIGKFVHLFDTESKSGMLTTLYDFLQGAKMVKDKVDADQMIFGLITLEEGEDVNTTSEGFIKAKLDRMSNEGLDQKEVEATVENFITASSAHFVSSFRENMTRQMTELSQT